MSIWTSKASARLILLSLSMLALPGCLDGFRIGPAPVPTVARVASGQVSIIGPEGFCVDEKAMRNRGDRATVLLASCAALGQSAGLPKPEDTAVLTVSVSRESEGVNVEESLPLLEEFFRSEAGRTTLGTSGNAGDVSILGMTGDDGTLIIHVLDSAAAQNNALRSEYWRALFDIGERTVSASVYTPEDRPLSDDAGQALLKELVARIREANTPA